MTLNGDSFVLVDNLHDFCMVQSFEIDNTCVAYTRQADQLYKATRFLNANFWRYNDAGNFLLTFGSSRSFILLKLLSGLFAKLFYSVYGHIYRHGSGLNFFLNVVIGCAKKQKFFDSRDRLVDQFCNLAGGLVEGVMKLLNNSCLFHIR